jgi:hypothetical protein
MKCKVAAAANKNAQAIATKTGNGIPSNEEQGKLRGELVNQLNLKCRFLT